MKKITVLFLLCFVGFSLEAQTITSSKRAADVYFLNKEYFAAAKYYQRALEIAQDSAFVVPYGFEKRVRPEGPKKEEYEYSVFQLANSLRLYRNFKDAEKWYAIAINFTDPKYALSGFWYAESLRANLRYDEAIAAFNSFIAKYNGDGDYKALAKLELESCQFALEEMKYPRLVILGKLSRQINGQGSNYAPWLNNQTLYFTSSRPISTEGKIETLSAANVNATVQKKETPYVNQIYATKNGVMQSSVEIEKVSVGKKNLEAAASALHPNGDVMFLTLRSNKPDKKRNIYISKKVNGNWSEPAVLGGEVNVMGSNAMQPFITADGKFLIFSSDRPGGAGKYDLWYSNLRPDYSVGNAVNLGPSINTKEDEQAPYYNANTQRLLYSSNGKVGMGGFDFYESMGDFSKWSDPKNLGYPFNSAKDDLYYTAIDRLDREGYISSDRESLCCLEIFHVKRNTLTITGKLIDCETLGPLVGANVTLSAKDFPTQNMLSDASGNYRFQVNSNRGFQLNVSKENYFAKNISFTYDQLAKADTLFSANLCLTPFKIDKPIVLENVLYEFDKATLTDSSKLILDNLYTIMIDNPNIDIELSAHTDIIGTHAYNMDLSDRRAKSCVDYLIEKGVSSVRMKSRGYGFTRPIAENKLPNGKDNPAGRALNRRTEFKVIKQ